MLNICIYNSLFHTNEIFVIFCLHYIYDFNQINNFPLVFNITTLHNKRISARLLGGVSVR